MFSDVGDDFDSFHYPSTIWLSSEFETKKIPEILHNLYVITLS